VGDLVCVAGAGALPRTHRRVVEQTLHERPREVVHPRRDRRVDVAEVAERPLQLAHADRLGLLAKLGQQRLDLELAVPAREAVDLLFDERLDLRDLTETRRHRVVEAGSQIVDVEESDTPDACRSALDVSRDREVDHDEQTFRALRHRRP